MSNFRGFIRPAIFVQQCFNPAKYAPCITPNHAHTREILLSRQWSSTTPTPSAQVAIDSVKRMLWNRPRGTKAGKNRRHAIQCRISDFRSRSNGGPGVNMNNLRTVTKTPAHELDKNVSFSLWNARSMNNKLPAVCASICEKQTDVFIVTESWLSDSPKQQLTISQFRSLLSGYDVLSCPRRSRKGGGTAVIARQNLNVKLNKNGSFTSFEAMDLDVRVGSDFIRLIVVYRPPPSKKNKATSNTFFAEFGTLLESAVVSPGRLLILGDFNFHMEDETDRDAIKFNELLSSLDLVQHVQGPTHDRGHTLDLVITRSSESCVMGFELDNVLPSDHSLIHFVSDLTRPRPHKVTCTSRKLAGIEPDDVTTCLSQNPFTPLTNPSVDDLVNDYDATMTGIINTIAPERTKVYSEKPRAPWFSDEIREHRKDVRKLERRYKAIPLEINKQIFRAKRSEHNRLINDIRTSYYRSRIENSDQRKLFSVIDDMTGDKSALAKTLPSHDDPLDLADRFSRFFSDKVAAFREKLDKSSVQPIFTDLGHSFTNFTSVSESDISKLILSMNSKSCRLDPIPTSVLKMGLPQILPRLTDIVNSSLSTGTFPSSLKHATVRPLLKKSGLDSEILKNYHPVSNLSFVGKVIEKVVVDQLDRHLSGNGLYSKFQSAYRRCHSTETALLKVQNDLLCAIDNHDSVILSLLDLSAAFDTIDHDILLKRLETRFGIKGLALDWLTSYLKGRTQCVTINGVNSKPSELLYGVPQGSVLGPILFILYCSPLDDILTRHGINYMMYADDTQVYITCKKNGHSKAVIEACIDEIRDWMFTNKLVLNDSKTEVIHLHSKFDRHHDQIPSLRIGTDEIVPSHCVRNLGFYFDSCILGRDQVVNVCKSASFALHRIGRIRHVLNRTTTEKLIHAFITSRLDYCNSLYLHLPDYLIDRLQRIQNSAARLVTLTRKHEHITPILQNLHWLPVSQRIDFKVLILTHRCLHNQAPSYISDLLSTRTTGINTRRQASAPLHEPRYGMEHYGRRAFSVAAPRLWNSLPPTLRSIHSLTTFKSQLKTYLFRNAYLPAQ